MRHIDEHEPGSHLDTRGYALTLSARVADQPGAAIWHGYAVYVPLEVPKLAVDARLPNRLQLTWGAIPDNTQPLTALRIERRLTPALPWVAVAQPNPATESLWVDRDVVPGTVPSYRIIALAQDGSVSDPSEPLLVTVPSTGLVWPVGQEVRGGSRPDDPDSVSILSWPNLPGIGTGVDISPDRTHVAVTTYTNGTNANRPLLTDLSGANIQVLDANTKWQCRLQPPLLQPRRQAPCLCIRRRREPESVRSRHRHEDRKDVLNQGVLYGWSADGTKVLLADGINKYGGPLVGLRWVDLADDSYTIIAGTASVPNERSTDGQSVDVSEPGRSSGSATPPPATR